jgi:hypothetical protein
LDRHRKRLNSKSNKSDSFPKKVPGIAHPKACRVSSFSPPVWRNGEYDHRPINNQGNRMFRITAFAGALLCLLITGFSPTASLPSMEEGTATTVGAPTSECPAV